MTKKSRAAFTLIEMLIVIAIIAILIAILTPAFTSVLEKGKVTQDMNNLRQIGLATQMYLNDNDGAFFLPDAKWPGILNPKYVGTWKTFQSPFDKNAPSDDPSTARVSYGVNQNATNTGAAGGSSPLLADRITNPSGFIAFAAVPDRSNPLKFSGTAGTPTILSQPSSAATVYGTHNNRRRVNVCMADWHVENMDWATFSDGSTNTTAKQRWNPLAQ
jgi:prepilin-type N-terminal cleavage/methylation domain-containing protein/prepilin-type processing-associated H-X9-DG protein